MKNIIAVLLAALLILFGSLTIVGNQGDAIAGPSDTVVIYPISADPCQNPSVEKQSAVISVSTGTTNLIALTASKSIYVCHVSVTLTGTTPDFQLVSGSTSTCSTSQVHLTGVIKPVTGTQIHMGYSGTLLKGSSSGAICAIMSAATTTAGGVITYVKQ